MSTRSQIKVRGSEIMIYKHSDGYPEGVLPTLTETMKRFIKERGHEPDYALAQIMRAFARRDEENRKEWLEEIKNNPEDYPEYMLESYQKQRMTGWGLDTIRHGDIEYMYHVDLIEGEIKVEHINWDSDNEIEQIVNLKE